jgi:hypothetical protein
VKSPKTLNKLLVALNGRRKKATKRPRTTSLIRLNKPKIWPKVQNEILNRTSEKQKIMLHKKLIKPKIMFQIKQLMPKEWLLKQKTRAKICTTEQKDTLLKPLMKFQILQKVQKEKPRT